MAPVPVERADISRTLSQPPQAQNSGSGSAGSAPSPLDRAPLGAYYLTEGLGGVEAQHYRCTRSFVTAINLQANQLCSGNAGQYAVFSQVTQDQLANIDRFRNTYYKSLRFLYYEHEETLIVKIMPGPAHAVARTRFEFLLTFKLAAMGLDGELCNMGDTTYQGIGSRKEGDSAFKPLSFRPHETDWPTLVIECGVSESLNRLKVDSNWWLENSRGQVKTVLLFSISKEERKIHIEQWEMRMEANPQGTRRHPDPTRTRPKSVHTIDIVVADAAGASLKLSFENLFLRKPGKGEKDIIFTTQDLERFAAHVWRGSQ